MKKSKFEEHGIRQTQKTLGLKSPNSITWHFTKLIEAGLVEQLPQNTYRLTDEGIEINEFEITTALSVKMTGGYLLPKFAFLLSFLITSILVALIIFVFVRNPIYLAFTGIVVSLLALSLILFEFLMFRRQLKSLNLQ